MNPCLIAALADQRIREIQNQPARHRSSSPQPASHLGNHLLNRVRLRRRIGMTLVEAGLRLLATTPAVPGK